ncbi:hypothetical protein, partial [Aeromonas veronii]|uniref:hypothetical protein n=1 Tax=Aeromonas veronii TaxID=654 RepID=UPI001A7E640F
MKKTVERYFSEIVRDDVYLDETEAARVLNASQLSLTGIVFIGFFHTIPLWPWLHAAGVTSLPSFRQHKL